MSFLKSLSRNDPLRSSADHMTSQTTLTILIYEASGISLCIHIKCLVVYQQVY